MENTYFNILPEELIDLVVIKLIKTVEVYTFTDTFELDENRIFKLLCVQLDNYFKKFSTDVIFQNYTFNWRTIYEEYADDDVDNQSECFYLYVYDYYHNNNKNIFEKIADIMTEFDIPYISKKWNFMADLINKLHQDMIEYEANRLKQIPIQSYLDFSKREPSFLSRIEGYDNMFLDNRNNLIIKIDNNVKLCLGYLADTGVEPLSDIKKKLAIETGYEV